MANRVLQTYEIKVKAKIDEAEKNIEKFKKEYESIAKATDLAGGFEDQFNSISKSLNELKNSTEKSFDEMAKSMEELSSSKMQKNFNKLFDDVSVKLDKLTQKSEMLVSAFNTNDSSKFDKFVSSIIEPLVDLTDALDKATEEFKKFNSQNFNLKPNVDVDFDVEEKFKAKFESLMSTIEKTLKAENRRRKEKTKLDLSQMFSLDEKDISAMLSKSLDEDILEDNIYVLEKYRDALENIMSQIASVGDDVDISESLQKHGTTKKKIQDTIKLLNKEINKNISSNDKNAEITRNVSLNYNIELSNDSEKAIEEQVKNTVEKIDKALQKEFETSTKWDVKIPIGIDKKTAIDTINESIKEFNDSKNINPIEVGITPVIKDGEFDKKAQQVADEFMVKQNALAKGISESGEIKLDATSIKIDDNSGVATEKTLSNILDVVNDIKNSGIPTSVKVASSSGVPSESGAKSAEHINNNGSKDTEAIIKSVEQSGKETVKAISNESEKSHGKEYVDLYRQSLGSNSHFKFRRGQRINDNLVDIAAENQKVYEDLILLADRESAINEASKALSGKKATVDNLKKTRLYSETIVGTDGKEYSRYGKDSNGRYMLKDDWQKYLEKSIGNPDIMRLSNSEYKKAYDLYETIPKEAIEQFVSIVTKEAETHKKKEDRLSASEIINRQLEARKDRLNLEITSGKSIDIDEDETVSNLTKLISYFRAIESTSRNNPLKIAKSALQIQGSRDTFFNYNVEKKDISDVEKSLIRSSYGNKLQVEKFTNKDGEINFKIIAPDITALDPKNIKNTVEENVDAFISPIQDQINIARQEMSSLEEQKLLEEQIIEINNKLQSELNAENKESLQKELELKSERLKQLSKKVKGDTPKEVLANTVKIGELERRKEILISKGELSKASRTEKIIDKDGKETIKKLPSEYEEFISIPSQISSLYEEIGDAISYSVEQLKPDYELLKGLSPADYKINASNENLKRLNILKNKTISAIIDELFGQGATTFTNPVNGEKYTKEGVIGYLSNEYEYNQIKENRKKNSARYNELMMSVTGNSINKENIEKFLFNDVKTRGDVNRAKSKVPNELVGLTPSEYAQLIAIVNDLKESSKLIKLYEKVNNKDYDKMSDSIIKQKTPGSYFYSDYSGNASEELKNEYGKLFLSSGTDVEKKLSEMSSLELDRALSVTQQIFDSIEDVTEETLGNKVKAKLSSEINTLKGYREQKQSLYNHGIEEKWWTENTTKGKSIKKEINRYDESISYLEDFKEIAFEYYDIVEEINNLNDESKNAKGKNKTKINKKLKKLTSRKIEIEDTFSKNNSDFDSLKTVDTYFNKIKAYNENIFANSENNVKISVGKTLGKIKEAIQLKKESSDIDLVQLKNEEEINANRESKIKTLKEEIALQEESLNIAKKEASALPSLESIQKKINADNNSPKLSENGLLLNQLSKELDKFKPSQDPLKDKNVQDIISKLENNGVLSNNDSSGLLNQYDNLRRYIEQLSKTKENSAQIIEKINKEIADAESKGNTARLKFKTKELEEILNIDSIIEDNKNQLNKLKTDLQNSGYAFSQDGNVSKTPVKGELISKHDKYGYYLGSGYQAILDSELNSNKEILSSQYEISKQAEDKVKQEQLSLELKQKELLKLEKEQNLWNDIITERKSFERGIKSNAGSDALKISEDIDRTIIEIQNTFNSSMNELVSRGIIKLEENGELQSEDINKVYKNIDKNVVSKLFDHLSSLQEQANEFNLNISETTGRAYYGNSATKQNKIIPGVNSDIINTLSSMTGAKDYSTIVKNSAKKEIERQDKEAQKQIQNALQLELRSQNLNLIKGIVEEQKKVEYKKSELPKELKTFKNASYYAGLSQEEADIVNKLFVANYNSKKKKGNISNNEKYLIEQYKKEALSLGLSIGKDGNAYKPNSKARHTWFLDPDSVDTNTFTHNALYDSNGIRSTEIEYDTQGKASEETLKNVLDVNQQALQIWNEIKKTLQSAFSSKENQDAFLGNKEDLANFAKMLVEFDTFGKEKLGKNGLNIDSLIKSSEISEKSKEVIEWLFETGKKIIAQETQSISNDIPNGVYEEQIDESSIDNLISASYEMCEQSQAMADVIENNNAEIDALKKELESNKKIYDLFNNTMTQADNGEVKVFASDIKKAGVSIEDFIDTLEGEGYNVKSKYKLDAKNNSFIVSKNQSNEGNEILNIWNQILDVIKTDFRDDESAQKTLNSKVGKDIGNNLLAFESKYGSQNGLNFDKIISQSEIDPKYKEALQKLYDSAKRQKEYIENAKSQYIQNQELFSSVEARKEANTSTQSNENGVSSSNDNYDILNKYSKEILQSYIDGAKATTPEMEKAYEELANIPIDIIEKVLEIGSPSKVTEQLGEWTAEGFANGITNGIDNVENATSNMVNSVDNRIKETKERYQNNPYDFTSEQFSHSTTQESLALKKKYIEASNLQNGYDIVEAGNIGSKNLNNLLNKAKGNLNRSNDSEKVSKWKQIIEGIYAYIEDNNEKYFIIDGIIKSVDDVKADKNKNISKGFKTRLNTAQKIIEGLNLDKYTEETQDSIAILYDKIKKLISKLSSLDFTDKNIVDDIETSIHAIEQDTNKYKGNEYQKASSSSITRQINTIDKLISKNTMAEFSPYKERLLEIKNGLQDALSPDGTNLKLTNKELDIMKSNINIIIDEADDANALGSSFLGRISNRLSDFNSKLIAQYLSWQDWIRYARQAYEVIKDLDTALTEMRKVSDESVESLRKYQMSTFDIASEIGTTAQQLSLSTADWMRIGNTLEEAAENAKQSTILMNVSEFESINDATNALVSMTQAYKDLSSNEIVDVLNNLGNNFPIATNELATGLQDSASALQTAGNDFYEASALITAGNALVQDANKVGTGMRTISLRLTGTDYAKEELEELGEDVSDFEITTSSKMQELIKDLTKTSTSAGVDILNENGNLKSTYEILLGIAEVWEEIAKEDAITGNNRQNALLEKIAGKTRANIAASILQNPEMLKEAYNAALDSAGSAQKENEKYLDSIEGRLSKLKNSLQKLAADAIGSDLIKNGITILTKLVDILDVIVDKITVIPFLIAGITTSMLVMNRNFSSLGILDTIKVIINQIKNLGLTETLANAFDVKKLIGNSGIGKFVKALKTLRDTSKKVSKDVADDLGDASKALLNAKNNADNLEDSVGEAETTVAATSSKFGLWGIVIAAAVVATGLLSKAIDKTVDSYNDLNKKIEDNKSEIDDYKDKINELNDNLSSLKEEKNSYEEINPTRESYLDNEINLTKSAISNYETLIKQKEELIKTDTYQALYGDPKKVGLSEVISDLFSGNFEKLGEDITDFGVIRSALGLLDPTIGTFNIVSSLIPTDDLNQLELVNEKSLEYLRIEKQIQDLEKKAATNYDENVVRQINNLKSEKLDLANELNSYSETLTSSLEYLNETDAKEIQGYIDGINALVTNNYELIEGKNIELKPLGISDIIETLFSDGIGAAWQRIIDSVFNSGELKTSFEKLKEAVDDFWDSIDIPDELLKEISDLFKKILELFKNIDLDTALLQSTIKFYVVSIKHLVGFITWVIEMYTWLNNLFKSISNISKSFDSFIKNIDTGSKVLDVFVKLLLKLVDITFPFDDIKSGISYLTSAIKDFMNNEDNAKFIEMLSVFMKGVKQGFTHPFKTAKDFILNGKVNYDYDSNPQDATEYFNIANDIKKKPSEEIPKPSETKYRSLGALLGSTDDSDLKKRIKKISKLYDEALKKNPEDDTINSYKEELTKLKSEYSNTWSGIKDELIGMAQAGKLDEDTLKSYRNFDEICKELYGTTIATDDQIKEMVDDINNLADNNAVDYLDNYTQGISNLSDPYVTYRIGKRIDSSSLNQIQSVYGNLDSYKAFENAVLSGETDLQKYFDDIATEYAKQEIVLGDLTEANQEYTIKQLVAAGITEKSAREATDAALEQINSIENVVAAQIEQLNVDYASDNAKKQLAISTDDLSKITNKEAIALLNEAKANDENAQSFAAFMANKMIAKGYNLDNPEELEYFIELASNCNLSTKELEKLAKAKAKLANIDYLKSLLSGTFLTDSDKKKIKEEIERESEDVKEIANSTVSSVEKLDYKYNLDFDLDFGGTKEDLEKLNSEAKELLDNMLDALDKALAAGKLDVKDYLNQTQALIQKFYDEGKISAAEYWDYIANAKQKELDIMDKVISAVTRQIDKQKEALEEQKTAIEESYNSQIEEIEKKKDALQEENDEIDKNMELQKAQYQLNRSLNQRTKLIYSESRGFHYEADWDAVSDAQSSVRKAQLDKATSEYEKQIKSLQETMEKETTAIDKQIKALEEYGKKWSQIAQDIQDAIEDEYAAQILGQNWTNDVLNQNMSMLQNFTDNYKKLYQEQADAAWKAAEEKVKADQYANTGKTTKDKTKDETKDKTSDTTNKSNLTAQDILNAANVSNDNKSKKINTLMSELDTLDAELKKLKNQIDSMPAADTKKLKEQYNKKLSERKTKYNELKKLQAAFTGTDSAQAGDTLVGELGSEIILNKNGTASIVTEPTIVKMQGGEKVFNAEETSRILNGTKYSSLSSYDPKKFKMLNSFANGTSSAMQNAIATQAVSIASGMNKGYSPYSTTNNNGTSVNNTFNVSLPNITDASRATDLIREFEALTMKGMQYFN